MPLLSPLSRASAVIELTPDEVQYQEDHAGQTLQPNVIAAVTILLVVAYVAVALRCLARYRSKVRFGVDDMLSIAALLPATGLAISIYLCTRFGMGKHVIYLTNKRGFVISYLIAVTMYAVANVLTKASIVCFYCRVFHNRNLVRLSWFLGAFIFAYDLAVILVVLLECIPLSSMWTDQSGQCIYTKPPITALGAVNVVVDFVLLAIPIRFVLRLQMNVWLKVQVCGIFLTGILTCIFGIVRVVEYAMAGNDDLSYDLVWPAVWAFCEIAIGILAASLPTMGVFFTKPGGRSTSMATSARTISRYISSRKSSIWSRKSMFSWKSERRSRPIITLLGSPEEEKPGPVSPEWPPTPTSMAEAAQPRYVIDVDIPSGQLHRHSGATDIITRFAPTMSLLYNHRWSRMSNEPAVT